MSIRVVCGCGEDFDVPGDRAGENTRCPKCGALVRVPECRQTMHKSDKAGASAQRGAEGAVAASRHSHRVSHEARLQPQQKREQESADLLLKAALDEVATLPPRNDLAIKASLVTSQFAVALGSLGVGVVFGLGLIMMEPANVHLPITLIGVVVGLVGIGLFFYFLARGLFFSLRRFDAKSVFESCLPTLLMCQDERAREKFRSLMLPSARKRYSTFCEGVQQACSRELMRRGGGFLSCKRWKVRSASGGRYATCVAELARSYEDTLSGSLNSQLVDQPLAEVTLYGVKSNAGNWYILFPALEATRDGLRFVPR